MAFDIDTLDRHYGTVPAAMVTSLSEEALDSYMWHLSFDLIKRRDTRVFGRFLLGITCAELKRRQSDGELEAGSFEIPTLPIEELPAALRFTTLITYDAPESLARLFDHLHMHFIGQAASWINSQ